MEKGWGFYATRERERRRSSASRWAWLLALAALLWIAGAMRAWPQNNGSSSSSNGSDLKTWDRLSEQFQEALTGQSERLRQALTELETSKASSLKLTDLLGESLKANSSLKDYNGQIAARMQERDEDLAAAYEEIGRRGKNSLRHWIVHIAMGAVILGYAALKAYRYFIAGRA